MMVISLLQPHCLSCCPFSEAIRLILFDVLLQLSGSEASNGLVLPAVAITYFGKAGAVLVVIICFMAVTSSGAGEGLACTSLFTYDVYRRYIRPKVSSIHQQDCWIICTYACCMTRAWHA